MINLKTLKVGLVTLATVGIVAACGGGGSSAGGSSATASKASAKKHCPPGLELFLGRYLKEEGKQAIAAGASITEELANTNTLYRARIDTTGEAWTQSYIIDGKIINENYLSDSFFSDDMMNILKGSVSDDKGVSYPYYFGVEMSESDAGPLIRIGFFRTNNHQYDAGNQWSLDKGLMNPVIKLEGPNYYADYVANHYINLSGGGSGDIGYGIWGNTHIINIWYNGSVTNSDIDQGISGFGAWRDVYIELYADIFYQVSMQLAVKKASMSDDIDKLNKEVAKIEGDLAVAVEQRDKTKKALDDTIVKLDEFTEVLKRYDDLELNSFSTEIDEYDDAVVKAKEGIDNLNEYITRLDKHLEDFVSSVNDKITIETLLDDMNTL